VALFERGAAECGDADPMVLLSATINAIMLVEWDRVHSHPHCLHNHHRSTARLGASRELATADSLARGSGIFRVPDSLMFGFRVPDNIVSKSFSRLQRSSHDYHGETSGRFP
jgi:hypothetical protein